MKTFSPIVLLAVLASACGPAKPPVTTPPIPAFRGLLATPRQLAFTCVVPGCDTTLTVRVTSNVTRRIAIKRIVLSNANEEYTLTPSEPPPFILGAASDFSVDVRFAALRAPRSESLDLLVTYTDASAEESPDRLDPGELKVPLVKRLVGEPILNATPETLLFGVVQPSQRKELPVQVKNVGFGNIALEVDRADSGTPSLQVHLPMDVALVPDAGVTVPFVFAPTGEAYLKTDVEVSSSTPGVLPVAVHVEGTSYVTPRIILEPEERTVDLGELPKGMHARVRLGIGNVGGLPLEVSSVSVTDPSNQVTAGLDGGVPAPLQPLQHLGFNVEVQGITPGPLEVPLKVVSNDPSRGTVELPIRVMVTEPRLQADPTSIDWGTVPMGWVVPKQVELKNVGYGSLTVKHITFVGGTSTLFTLKNLPALPIKLARNERAAFEVEFRSQTAASFTGGISIETDDPVDPFSEVTLAAAGGTCAAGCPIINGTPSCDMGQCTVGSCNTGWHDTDLSAANGCECREIGTDPGGFCSTGIDKGTLSDNGSSANHTGIIDSATDEDNLRFFGEDQSQFLSDDYDVEITLTSTDPDIVMCVSRYDTETSVNECYQDANKTCGIKSLRRDGSTGREDGAMYYIRVYRNAGAPATCTPYTVYMRNG